MTALFRMAAATSLALACVPVETVDVPPEIDWVALIGTSAGDLEPGRLYRATQISAVGARSEGWLVGYEESVLIDAFVQRGWIDRVVLRRARARERALPTPRWVVDFAIDEPLPPLTAEFALAGSPQIVQTPRQRWEVQTYDIIANSSESPGVRFGPSDAVVGGAVIAVNNSIYSVDGDGLTFEGRNDCNATRSIIRHEGLFWIAGTDSVCSGSRLSTMSDSSNLFFGRRPGKVHANPTLGLLIVTDNGEVHSADGESWWPSLPAVELAEIDVASDADGTLWVASKSWGFRLKDSVVRPIALRSPFTSFGEDFVFSNVNLGIVRFNKTSLSVDASFVVEGREWTEGPRVTDVESSELGIFVLEDNGQIVLVNQAGLAEAFFRFVGGRFLFSAGGTMYAVSKGAEATDLFGNRSQRYTFARFKPLP